MAIQFFTHYAMPRVRQQFKLPLHLVLIVPFVIEILAVVGIVGWLSFRNGQKAIETLARDLQSEIGHHIETRLDTYISSAARINQRNTNLASSQKLNLEDLTDLSQHFLQQLLLVPEISYINWASEKGEFAGAYRDSKDRLELILMDRSTNGDLVKFRSDRDGNIDSEIERDANYDPRVRPWYRAAVKAQSSAWTSPYAWYLEGILAIDLVVPFYEEKTSEELKGVFAVSFTLEGISEFLGNLKIGKSGQAFIFERSSQLIGTSFEETLVIDNGKERQPLSAFESSHLAIRQTVEYLQAEFGDLSRISQTHKSALSIEGERHFLQVQVFQDDAGLDWLIAIIIPEADFMEQINANTRTTMWLCLLALGTAMIFGFLAFRAISKPILALDRASQAIAKGDLEQQVPTSQIEELENLATSFNQMSCELKRSREQLADYSGFLEHKIAERTKALRISEERFQLVAQSVNDGIWDWRIDRDELYLSPQWKLMLGYSDETLPNQFSTWELLVHPEDLPSVLQAQADYLVGKIPVFHREFRMRHQDGSYRWILSRAKVVEQDEKGKPRRVVGSHTDISDRKQFEQQLQTAKAELEKRVEERTAALQEQRAFLRTTIDSNPNIIFVKDREGRYTLVNQAFADFFGTTVEEVLGKTDGEIHSHLKEVAQFLEDDQRTILMGKTQMFTEKVTAATGETRYFHTIKTPLKANNLENSQILGVATDITDLKAAELALQQSEAKNRAILTALPDVAIRMSADGIYLDRIKSKDFQSAIPDEVDPIGKHVCEFLPEEAESLLKAARAALTSGERQVYEQEIWLERHTRRYEEIRVVPCGQNEVLILARDVTDKKMAELALHLQQKQSEHLLLNILPRSIAERLKIAKNAIADYYESASILFADLVGFTPLSSQISPTEVVKLLDRIFSTFDKLAEQHGLEKIKTIGDAYMVAGGLPDPKPDHLEAIANMALAMQEAMPSFQTEKLTRHLENQPLQIRIGIATGPVVAGVIGQKKFSYDLWGDTVNLSSRMESQGEAGKIQVTAWVYEGLCDHYYFRARGPIAVKGKGKMTTYWLLGKKKKANLPEKQSPLRAPLNNQEILCPPQQELQHLYRAAQIGDFRTIKQEAERLQHRDPNYEVFCQQILVLAEEFSDREILDLIENS